MKRNWKHMRKRALSILLATAMISRTWETWSAMARRQFTIYLGTYPLPDRKR